MVIISGLYGNSVRKYNRSVLFVNKSETHFRGTCKNEYLLEKIVLKVFLQKPSKKKSFLWIEIQNPSEENCFDYLPSKILLNLSFQMLWPSPMSNSWCEGQLLLNKLNCQNNYAYLHTFQSIIHGNSGKLHTFVCKFNIILHSFMCMLHTFVCMQNQVLSKYGSELLKNTYWLKKNCFIIMYYWFLNFEAKNLKWILKKKFWIANFIHTFVCNLQDKSVYLTHKSV